jgi:hypothetical protein
MSFCEQLHAEEVTHDGTTLGAKDDDPKKDGGFFYLTSERQLGVATPRTGDGGLTAGGAQQHNARTTRNPHNSDGWQFFSRGKPTNYYTGELARDHGKLTMQGESVSSIHHPCRRAGSCHTRYGDSVGDTRSRSRLA